MAKSALPNFASWVEVLASAKNLVECTHAFKTIVATYRVAGFASGEIDLSDRTRSTFLVVEWPEPWRKFYTSGVVERDPLFEPIARLRRPFTWSELFADPELKAADARAFRLAAEAGWEEGLVVPIVDGDDIIGIVSLLRARGAFSRREAAELTLVSVYFHTIARGLSTATSFAAPPLTLSARSREALSLAAHGLSDKDIAKAMSISDTTVREHIENAMLRLRAKTRTQAVALGLALHVIKL